MIEKRSIVEKTSMLVFWLKMPWSLVADFRRFGVILPWKWRQYFLLECW